MGVRAVDGPETQATECGMYQSERKAGEELPQLCAVLGRRRGRFCTIYLLIDSVLSGHRAITQSYSQDSLHSQHILLPPELYLPGQTTELLGPTQCKFGALITHAH